jgi:HSP20 family protein
MMEDMERRFEDILGRSWLPVWRRTPQAEEEEWMPVVDIYEQGDMLKIKAELPGMKEEDIDVSVSEGNLILKGEKKTESEIKEEDYYRCERTYGSFYRSIPMPSNIDSEKVEANYENGVLEVSIPKTAESKTKKVPVSARKMAGSEKHESGGK